jgi:dipeptidyl aminopeptidase/acylaminoacyl peptidase
MREFSPINQVENLQGPVLLIAGRQDRVVGFEQSERFLQTAQDLGKDVEMLDFDDEGHGNFQWTNKVKRARTFEDFLADHLGGRSGGWDLIEAAIPYLD